MEELLQFLKKYSDVDVEFIQQFISIQKGDNLHVPFTIDLDLVSKWLKTKKDKLKKTLNKSYIVNIDFILLPPKVEQDTHGGHNKEVVLLTPDTFKMLTMKSHTKDAQKVRYYYVTLEKLIEIYKDDIIQNQNEKIEKLERNLKKMKYPVEGAVYIVRVSDSDDEFKIGKTVDMNKRLKTYNTSHKDDPEVVFIFYTHDIHRLEKCVKVAMKYYEYRHGKEFYKASKQKIMDAIEQCNALITNFVNNDKNDKNVARSKLDQNEDIIFKIDIDYDDKQTGGQPLVCNNNHDDVVNKTMSVEELYLLNKENYIKLKTIGEMNIIDRTNQSQTPIDKLHNHENDREKYNYENDQCAKGN
jgi:hypothetical protein